MRRLALLAVPGALVVALALVGPLLVGSADETSRGVPFLPPRAGSWLGTDHLGRDVWAVLLSGGRPLVLLPMAATLLGTVIGASFGMLAGWYGGPASRLGLRAAELALVVPPLLVAILAVNAVEGAGTTVLLVAVAVLGVPATMRFTRAATVAVSGRGYVDHAVALGERVPMLLVREVLPTIAAPVLADAGLRLVGAIYVVASLSFLGLGGPTLDASWASMVAENVVGVSLNPWALAAPAVCVVLFAVSVNLVADRLADRFRRSL